MTDYSPADLAYMDRYTYRPPKPLPEAAEPVEPTKHPLAGNRPGVRSTSRKALAQEMSQDKLGPKQAELLRLLQSAKRPACDAEIGKALGWSINRVTARRNDLVEMGKVEEAFRDIYPATGKRVIFWRAVEARG